MLTSENSILIINGGSSSIKFALYKIEESLTPVFYGAIGGIGTQNVNFKFTNSITNESKNVTLNDSNYANAVNFLIRWLEQQDDFVSIKVIGHRIVYGMKHTAPEWITSALLDELNEIMAFDPEHMPGAIQLIEGFRKQYSALPQIACFDTSFHASMPSVAKLLPIPRRFYEKGIQRYGFHGLSYAYLLGELNRVAGDATAQSKIIMAHLGNGASLAAIKEGKSMDTSMGFTPTSGLPMSTRTGDLDPGVACYLLQAEKFSPEQFNHLINYESGLLGISETNSDMRELLKCQYSDKRAAEAIELFCYQTKKWIGSFGAVLGGLDTLVFSGGIGENAPEVRQRICEGLQFLGIELDEAKNKKNEPVISTDNSTVSVRVIPTNEELMIARLSCHMMNYTIK
jgi:acetate kinase